MTDQINETDSPEYRKLIPVSTEIESVEQGRSLVVVIGVNEYVHQPKLKNAVQDAKGIQQILCDKLGFSAPIPPLLNEAATKTAIVSLVEDRLYEIVEENDSLIVFFAGHGQTRVRKVGNQVIETGFIVPVDATQSWSNYVEIDSFLNNIGNLSARHILVILDCCHSGFALSQAVNNFRDPIVIFKNKLSKQISRRVITSALKDEQALDGGGPILGHSLFSGILIDGLSCGKADLDRNGLITSSELGLFLQQEVQRTAMESRHIKQTPDFGSFHRTHDRGEMIIALNKEKDLIDYTSLESCLKKHRWKEADLMTFAIMLKLSNCEDKEYLDVEDIQRLAFRDLQSIDELWTLYSNNHFGFSVQSKIWQNEPINGNPRSGLKEFRVFGNSVGWNEKREAVDPEVTPDPDRLAEEYIWHRHKNLNFSLQSPKGHLPWGGYGELGMSKRWRLGYLFLRFSQDEKSDIEKPSKISSGGTIIGKPIIEPKKEESLPFKSNNQHPVIRSNFDRNLPVAIVPNNTSLSLSVTNQQDKLRPTLEGYPDLTSIIDNQLDLAHLAAIDRHTTPDTDLQLVARTNTEVWRQFITEHLYDTRRVTLEYFHLFEWFPIKPGQFHAPGAEEQRQNAYEFAEWHSGLAELGYLPKGSSLDAGLYFNPFGKASMIRGGVGSVRLRPRSIHGVEYYFMTASSTGVCHEGFPVLIPRHLFGSLKRRILNEGAVPVILSGEMRYISDNILTFFGRHRKIPLLYLHVDQVKELPQPRSEVTSYEVSAAISFVGNFQGHEEKYVTYANFAPESQDSFQQACNWLEQFYVKKYAGTVVTDFDEVIPRFPEAVFGLPDLMSGNLDRSRVQRFLQHQGLGEKTGEQFLAAYEELSISGMLKA